MQLALDLIEVLAVFLLAVEAIKLENLSKLSTKLLAPTLKKVNPEITYVENVECKSFLDKYGFALLTFGFYVVGFLILLLTFSHFNIDVIEWVNGVSRVHWLWFILCFLFVPIIVGLLPYTCVVFAFELSIRGLTLVERHTATGAVGIAGFALYLIQFLGRRLLTS